MVTSKMILVAETVIKDNDTNSISVINILEDITAESFPIMIQRIALIAFLEKLQEDDDKPYIKLRIINNKTVLLENIIKADFRGKIKNRNIIKMAGLLIGEPGITKFELLNSDENLIGQYELSLRLREPVKIV